MLLDQVGDAVVQLVEAAGEGRAAGETDDAALDEGAPLPVSTMP